MRLERNGNLIAVMQPSRRTFPVQRMTTTEAAIHTNGMADLYVYFYEQGLKIVTTIKSNMKNKLRPVFEKLCLMKRGVIESVNDLLMD